MQRMHETLYQTSDAGVSLSVDAGDTLSDSGCSNLSIRQRMQETLSQTADAGDYQTVNAGVSLSDSG